MRSLPPVSLVVLLALATGCSSARPNNSRPNGIEETSGAGGETTGGSPGTGGSRAGTGGSATGGSVGSTGGSTGSGGSGPVDSGSAVSRTDSGPDAPASMPADAAAGETGALRAWIIPCAPDWTRAQCCMHYCACMMKNCAERLPATCVETCSAPGNNWNLKCRVEQCFESTNPGNQKDRASHCGHAVEKPLKCQGLIP